MILQINFLVTIGFITLISFVFIVFTFSLLCFFLFRFIKTRQIILGYLVAMNFFYIASLFLVVFQFFSSNQERAEFFFILSEISKILVIYFLILIFEIFYKNTQFSRRQTIITILVFIIIGGYIAGPRIEVELLAGRFFIMGLPLLSTIKLLEFIFSITATLFVSTILLKSRKNAWNFRQKIYITWLLVGSLIGILFPALLNFILEDWVIIGEEFSVIGQLIQSIPETICILIVGLIFFKISNNLWLLQHQKVYFLIVYSHGGLTLYSKSFHKDITSTDTQLLAGAFSAISSLIKDGTKTTGMVQGIMLEGKVLKIINRKNFICALLVEYSTHATEEAHEKFTLEFEKEFHDTLENFNGEVTIFNSADKISDKFFT